MSEVAKNEELATASVADEKIGADDTKKQNEEVDKHDEAELQQFIQDMKQKIETRETMRKENLHVTWPLEDYFTKLDSSLKKNTAFVKKLKQFTSTQLDSLLKDISGLNLTKYISEISQAIAEAKIKVSDIPAAITLCSKLHQTYPEFSKSFLDNWQKILVLKPNEKITNPSKMRVDLRFFAELLSCGVFPTKVRFFFCF